MTVMTLEDAARHLGVTLDTLHDWRTTGHLIAVEHPCVRDQWLVETTHLLDVDLAMHRGTATPVALEPMKARDLAAWLTEQTGRTVTKRTIEDWAEDGDLRRIDPGGRGTAALYDPHRALAVHAARTRRLPVVPEQPSAQDSPLLAWGAHLLATRGTP